MKEPMIVTHAQLEPYACAVCTNTTGPFSDTFFEDLHGRKYLCQRCIKTNARVHGLAPGARMDELENAARLVAEKDLEIGRLVETIDGLTAAAGSDRRTIADLCDRLEALAGTLQAAGHVAETIEVAAKDMRGLVSPRAPVEEVAA